MAPLSTAVEKDLRTLIGAAAVLPGDTAAYLVDETETRNLRGFADAIAFPRSVDDVARVMRYCYDNDVTITPRGGGTGYAGGCVPFGGVVLSLERMDRLHQFDPLCWRMHVEAGTVTATVRKTARENGLLFPPDPGAGEQSQIGGNIATNAGGPHAFKYGTTGAWVTGLQAVVPPGDVVTFGGSYRKDVAGYDFKNLLIGSEGTLGIITAAWLTLVPAPEAAYVVAGFFEDVGQGCDAIETVIGSGLKPSAIEYVDAGALRCAPATFAPQHTGTFVVLIEVDGSEADACRLRADILDVLAETALALHAPREPAEVQELWRWREGMTAAVTTARGGKVSEDICVPFDRLREAIEATVAIGKKYQLEACSWGHAGDGNLHSTFLLARDDVDALRAAEHAVDELFKMAAELGGTISGEHGIGVTKNAQLQRIWSPRALALRDGIKREFDPKNLLNPGKKL